MTGKTLAFEEGKDTVAREVRYYHILDEDTMDALPALPGFIDLLKTGYFSFNFGAHKQLAQAAKGYTGEKNFVIYDHQVPFDEDLFQELVRSPLEYPFEKLIIISPFRPEVILGKASCELIDRVSTINRTGNIFLVGTEGAESYFGSIFDG